jgi:hypothetical protein
MKKILFITAICFCIVSITYGQDYKKFRVGLAVGYVVPSGFLSVSGALLSIEPSYRIMDNLSIGLRLEYASFTRGASISLSGSNNINPSTIVSYTVNGQYYLSKTKFRPFVGAGIGAYSLADVSISGPSAGTASTAQTNFGFYPRVGFDIGHFSISADYNIVSPSSIPLSKETIINNYLGLKLGVYFGGGKL